MRKEEKELLLKIIDLLYNTCIGQGGDGWCVLCLKTYKIEEILPLVEEYNSKLKFKFEIEIEKGSINWGEKQEWIVIAEENTHLSPATIEWADIYIKI